MRIIGALMMLACLLSCQERTKITGQKENRDTVGADIPIAAQACYAFVKDRDTAEIALITTGNVSTGELTYKWFEKDHNIGSIEGEMHGDTLIANYTFNSEGQQSVRQVVFLKKGNELIEGFGDVEDKNGRVVFKDLSAVVFGKEMVFRQVACK